jgi:hypothetical protein
MIERPSKIEAKKQEVPTLQKILAALCNAGGFSGLRRLHDRARLAKVSIPKGRAFDRVGEELVVLAGVPRR